MSTPTRILILALLCNASVTRAGFTDANWSPLGSGMNGAVDALAVSSNGTLYAGGTFTTAGGVAANYVAQWNGTNWLPLGSGMNSNVFALAVSGNTLYAGGAFTNAGGIAANYIAQWDGTNWSPLGSGMAGSDPGNPFVSALAVSGEILYAGGNFWTAGGTNVYYIAQWNGTNWSGLGSGMVGDVGLVDTLVVSSNGNLFAGGAFSSAGGTSARYGARWNGTNWSALVSVRGDWGPIYALTMSGTNLYAGGPFGEFGPSYIAQLIESNWSALGSGMEGSETQVSALATSGTNLYAGGEFTSAGGTNANYIALWNGSSWSALGSGLSGGFPWVKSLVVSANGTLYVGGVFTKAGTNAANNIAQAILPVSLSILTTDGNFGFTNGYFGFEISGPPGSNVIIQTSTDLQNWTPLQTDILNSNGLLYFSDTQSSISTHRFYQAVVP